MIINIVLVQRLELKKYLYRNKDGLFEIYDGVTKEFISIEDHRA